MFTSKGASMAFPMREVVEYKKTSKGLKGIKLSPDENLTFAGAYSADQTEITIDGKPYNLKRVKVKKRGDKPSKTKILL